MSPPATSVTIDVQALKHNLARVRVCSPISKIWAVVKANAYGHGLSHAIIGQKKADGFAVLNLDEAIRLRELGWYKPILLLEGFFSPEDLNVINYYHLTTNVHCEDQLRMIETTRLHHPLNIYLKMNTGLNRLGFPPEHYRAVWKRARKVPSIHKIGLMTHFANADNKIGISEQYEIFKKETNGIIGERSIANSATILYHPSAQGEWIRPGILLYGASPTGQYTDIANEKLHPAMTFSSRIIAIQQLKTGDSIGYGSLFRTLKPMRVGIVACGYRDGYPRQAPTGTPISVDGVRTCTVGRVSMDMLAVDLSPCSNAQTGTEVELWGKQIPIDEVAQSSGTISYELMCRVMPRVLKII